MSSTKRNPFKLDRPARIAFSGGRTSGLMLWKIREAFDGCIPSDVIVTFANTGKERFETLDFVHEIEEKWGIDIRWLEYCRGDGPAVKKNGKQLRIGCHSFRQVDYHTASRNGEPFEAIIEVKAAYRKEAKDEPAILPNPVQRFCTAELKQRTMQRYMQSLGYEEYTVAIGLRADEMKRVKKLDALSIPGEEYVAPLSDAGITVADVTDFWNSQSFDLKLENHPQWGTYEGNCDFCFLKSQAKTKLLAEKYPEMLDWWAKMEEETGQTFRKDRSFKAIKEGRVSLKMCDDSQDTCFCTD